MARFLIVFLFIFFAAALLTVLIEKDAGFVLLNYDEYFLRTSIWVFFGFYLISFLSLYILIKALLVFFRLIKTGSIRPLNQNLKQTYLREIEEGLLAFFENDYSVAASHFIKIQTKGSLRGLSSLFGARSARKMGDAHLLELFLNLARKESERIRQGANLLEAEMALELAKPDLVLENLAKKELKPTKHSKEIKINALLEAKKWQDVFKSLSLIDEVKDRILFEKKAAILAFDCNKKKDDLLVKVFNSLSKELKEDSEIILAYFRALEEKSFAEALIIAAIDLVFKDSLIMCYFDASRNDPKILDNLTRWEKTHPENSLLPLLKGKLYEMLEEDVLAEKSYKKSKDLGNFSASDALMKFFVSRGNLKKARQELSDS